MVDGIGPGKSSRLVAGFCNMKVLTLSGIAIPVKGIVWIYIHASIVAYYNRRIPKMG